MRTLKREEIYANTYRDLEDLRAHIEEFIERYYNRIRLHSALGYLPPEEFEQAASGQANGCGAASMSFFRHGEIYRWGKKTASEHGEPNCSSSRPILSMSLQPAIPWRVALQQSPTPLHRLSTMLKEKQRLEKTITLNGNCVFRRLSHSRGSPHGCPGLDFETWETTNLVRANSERLAAPQCLLFLLFHRPFGVGQDFVSD